MDNTTKTKPRQPAGAFIERDQLMPGTVWHSLRAGHVQRAHMLHVTKDRAWVVIRYLAADGSEFGPPLPLAYEELQPAWRMQPRESNGEVYQLHREDPNAAGTRETATVNAVDTASCGRVPTWIHRPESTVVAVRAGSFSLDSPGSFVGLAVTWDSIGVAHYGGLSDRRSGMVEEIVQRLDGSVEWLIVRQVTLAHDAQEVVP